MKKNNYFHGLFSLFVLLLSTYSNAQMSDTNAFMIGDYIEIGISSYGYEGAPLDDAIPTHHRGITEKLGFVANPAADGWVNYNGGYYQPGTPESGFGVNYTIGATDYSFSNNAIGEADIPGSITEYYETTDSIRVTWVGITADSLQLTIVYTLKKDQHYYRTAITFDNIGSEIFTNVYYFRTLDPDVNQEIGWGFSTQNTIESQSGVTNDSVIVSAAQTSAWTAEMILEAYGSGWRGSHGSFSVRSGADIWNGCGALTGTEGATTFADQAISIAHKTPSIPPGRSRVESETFSFATAFKRGIIYEEENEEEPETDGINEHEIDFKMYPNPTGKDLVNITVTGAFSYEIVDLKGNKILTGLGNDQIQVDLNGMENGIYLVTIIQNDAIITKKLVIR